MLPKSPFPEDREWADLQFTQSVMLADGGGPACAKYRPVGLQLLGDRKITPAQYMSELKEIHEGHWRVGMESIGWMGRSRDVSRKHHMNLGEW